MNYRRLIFSFLILTTGLFVYPNWVQASTLITNNITENTAWTLENSPYVVENYIYISGSSTLTIEPGVVVKFADFAGIYFYDDAGGSISALGTPENKIYFTSLADDEVSGDTDGNGVGTIPEINENSNAWYGIDASGQSVRVFFDNAVFRYSLYALSFANILEVSINNSIFEKNYVGIGDGGKSHVSILNTKIINNYKGIYIKQTVQEINSTYATSGLSIYGNFEYGVQNLTRLPPPLTRKDHNIFHWLVDLFTPNSVLAQEEPVVIEEDPVPDEEYIEYDYTLDFKNTWWGDASGPRHPSLNPHGQGNAVSGDVLFTPFCKNSNCTTRNPVIIVPGLLGTEISKPTADGFEKLWLDLLRNAKDVGDQFMDALQFNSDMTPSDTSLVLGDVIRKKMVDVRVTERIIFDYSGSLLKEFENQGYVEDTDLFLFPYDWRFGVSAENVNKLKRRIADVLVQTGANKVDIVAHSMGGLITKKYVVENPTEHRIDKTIFVGVPNTGSVKAVKNLLTGDGNILTSDKEMQKLSINMPAAYDLLPSEEYFNKKGSYVQIIDLKDSKYTSKNLNFSEVSSFLAVDHGLNVKAVINALHLHTSDFDNYDFRTAGINLYAINGCKAGTFSKITELRDHPYLRNSAKISYFTPEEAPGDGTVLLESSTNLPINQENKFYALEGKHAEMLSANGVRQQIVNIISGSKLSTKNNDDEDIITQDIDKCELNGKAISIYSPLSIIIVDQDGNYAGLSEDGVSIENNIPNADFQIMGEHKFVYLPTDEGQNYTINVTGTGTGTFTLTDANIDANEVTGMQVFENISVTPSLLGRLDISENTTLVLDDNGDETIDRTLSPTFQLGGEEARDFIPSSVILDETPDKNNSSGSSVSGSLVNKQDTLLPAEIMDSPIVTMENSIKNTLVKQQEENPQVVQVENPPKENLLTANVANTKTSTDYRIIIISLSGIIILLLVAQKFNKG